MREKIWDTIRMIQQDRKTVRQLYYATLICALFLASLVLRNGLGNGKYIVDESGNVIGIERKSIETYEEYPLQVIIRSADSVTEREILLAGKSNRSEADEKGGEADSAEDEEENAQQRELELDNLISDLENGSAKKLTLPTSLSDGSSLTWKKAPQRSMDGYLVAGMYISIILLILYAKVVPGKRKNTAEQKAVLSGLPRFVNQLVMMMNAGIILSDAFDRICRSYAMIPEASRSGFEKQLVRLKEQNLDHRVSTAVLLHRYAGNCNVKELMRISTILMENERRGSDVVNNLSRESQFLWEERKIIAAEKGKAIDAKMAIPLSLLLMLLIVITMAPAIMSM